MSLPGLIPGLPGMRSPKTATHRIVFRQDWDYFFGLGKIIDGSKSADPGNTGDTIVLRPGVLMGKITASGKYANSIIDVTAGSLSGSGTSITLSANGASELNRRVGSSGTFTLTGPPTANGTARSLTITYSAVNTSSGVVTMTAAGVTEVQTFNFANSPAGTFRLAIVDSSGVVQYTQRITYNATIGTLLSNLQAATDAVLAANAIVWSGTLVTAVAATFSGTGYANLPQVLIAVDSDALTAGSVSVTRTTAGVDGRFVAGSFVGGTDGSQVPNTIIPDGYGILVTDSDFSTRQDTQFQQFPIAGVLIASQIINWPTDTGLQNFIMNNLSTASSGKFIFDTNY